MPVGPPLGPVVPTDFPHAGAYGSDNFVTSSTGAPVPAGTPAAVYQTGSTTLAPLYADRNRTASAPNPLTLASLGNLRFYTDPGDYDVVVNGIRLPITAHPYPLDTLGGAGEPGTGIDPDAVAAMFTGSTVAPLQAVYASVATGGDGTVTLSLSRDLTATDMDATISTVNADGSVNGTDGTTPLDATFATHAYTNRAIDVMMTIRDFRYGPNTVMVAVADNTPLPVTLVASSVVGRGATGDARAVLWSELPAGGGSGLTVDSAGPNTDWTFGAATVSGGTGPNVMHGGVIRQMAAIDLTTSQTVTANTGVNDFTIGTSILARMNQILDNNRAVLGPIGYSSTPLPLLDGQSGIVNFPMAHVQVDGDIQYNQSASGFGGAGVGVQILKHVTNQPGMARNISGHQGVLNVPVYTADGANIQFAAMPAQGGTDPLDGVVGVHQGYCDWPLFGVRNGGQLTKAVGIGFSSWATFAKDTSGDMRIGFKYHDAQTNINQPAAPPGGDNILQLTEYGSLYKQVAILIPHLKGAVGNVGIYNGSTTVFDPPAPISLAPSAPIPCTSTLVYVAPTVPNMVTTSNPQIIGGLDDGQMIRIMNTSTLGYSMTFRDGFGLDLPANNRMTLRPGMTAEFTWWAVGALWFLSGRSQGGFIDTGPVAGGGSVLKVDDAGANSLFMSVYAADSDLYPVAAFGTEVFGAPAIQFGPGGAVFPDTKLGRSAPGVLAVTKALSLVGMPGATTPTRWVGGTTAGAPVTGTFAQGDFITTLAGRMWVCTFAGTPGIWLEVGSQPTGTVTFTDGGSGNMAFGSAVGTKIGTATTQRLGFWNATPIVRPARPTDTATIINTLVALGLCA